MRPRRQKRNPVALAASLRPAQRAPGEIANDLAEATTLLPGHGPGRDQDVVINRQCGSHITLLTRIKHHA